MAAESGKTGDVTINSVALKVTSWELDYNIDKLETTNKGSSGWREFITGLKGVDWSCEANWDASINSGDPPNPLDDQLATCTLATASKTFSFATVIESMKIKSDVNGVVTYTMSGSSTGAVTVS